MIHPGATVLTANQRLSRTLRKAFDDQQLAAGRTAWASPDILPFGTWLHQRWSDAALTGALPPLKLLNAAQAETLWMRIIEQSAAGASLLDLRGAAESAMRAWELVQQYRLPLDGRYSAHEDWSAFWGWAQTYAERCRANHWTDEARLPDAVREGLQAGAVRAPQHVLLAGFDEFTPQQKNVLEALPHWELLEPAAAPSLVSQVPCAGAADELAAAAAWAREHRGASVGIVLLSARTSRQRLERVFEECASFHISMGDPLAAYPLVSAALLVLRLAGTSRWPAEDAGRLLRCPYVAGGIEHASERALIDVQQIRRWRRAWVSPKVVRIADTWVRNDTAELLPSEWAPVFRSVLQAAGFPGDRALTSHEYQVLQSWSGLLGVFESLDATGTPESWQAAVARLHELAAHTEFQPQDPGARVQILGPLEAAGARFDHLWICGADDQTWPAPAHPHPFLPLQLQRDHRLPHSSAEREFEFAARTFERLKVSAPEVMVSWPQRAGDVELRPSPLLDGIPLVEYRVPRPVVAASLQTEERVDELAPPLATTQPRGGTNVIRLQSACPFRAFADLRLGARTLESGELGLSAADRGRAIHKALELFWTEVRSHAELCALHGEDLERVARRAADQAVRAVAGESHASFDRAFRLMETDRVAGLLMDWASVEKQRSPFEVMASERERTINIGGLELAARIDRVDELPGQRAVIIDYKTNAPSANAWFGKRPDEPQVPLYAISSDVPVAAVAFAHVGAGEQRFRGASATAGILPGVRPAPDFAAMLDEWRRVLEPLASAFRNGAAEVDPRDAATCAQCGLTSLCRIHEVQEPTDAS